MNRDALVVGINQYQDDNLRNLKAPAEDAEAIAKTLEKYSDFNVVSRLPEAIDPDTRKPYIAKTKELSLTQLKKALVKLFKPEGRQVPDTALFYFSGHGIREDQGIQEGFLASSNVSPISGFYGLSLQWLRRLLEESPIRQQIIWLDCCHSGELLNFNEADPGEQGQARDRCFIAASREFDSSYEDLNSNYSVLTRVLLEGLDPNRCPQQWITNYSLIEFINQNLRHENQRPVFTNFGSPINLTRTLDTKIPPSKGQDSKDICPYKGLEYFDCNDKDPKYFYGREKLTDKLIDRVRQNNFLAILGASGSGKSSVMRAGLLHQLKLGRKLAGSQDWKIKIMLPEKHPLQSLALSWLESDLSDAERATQLDQIESLLQQGGEGLRKLVQASKANRVILVVDQFEEAFTLCEDVEEREAFFQCLLEALEQTDNKLCLIMAMRIDFFGKCFERKYSGLGNKIQDKDNFIAVPSMDREELRQAIIEPAKKVNLSLESGLAEEILRDIEGSPGTLPLLQDTLTELWKRKKDHQLKLSTYVHMGGIGGTLNRRATDVYNSLTKQEQYYAKHIFLSLTTLGEGTEDTRRRVLKQDLVIAKHDKQLIYNVVQKLADEKLIVTRERTKVDVAHEALIRNWKLLRQWLDECRDLLRQKHKIEDAAIEWQSSGEKIDYLLSKKRLKEAKYFQKEQQEKYPLSELAGSFVAKSSKYQRRETIKSLGIFLIIPLIGTIIGGYFVVREVWLNADKTLIQQCEGKEYCHGRIEALERLVKAKKNLKSYNLRNADLRRADLRRANLIGADLRNAKLRSANLIGANLIGADLRSANLRSANLIGANLIGAKFQKAIYTEATKFPNQFNSAGMYLIAPNSDLNFANLNGVNLNGANLENADLNFANLNGAYLLDADLNFANLNGANLRNAKLIRANLENAKLIRANLENADLNFANLNGANLENAKLNFANLIGANLMEANLNGANLIGASLMEANLNGANLIGAKLNLAKLNLANLENANLNLANLENANLENANLNFAYLNLAKLNGAYLNFAYLINAKYLTPSQIKSACNWQKAIYKGNWNWDKKNYQWTIDEKANTKYIEELKQDKASDPEEPVNCS